MNRLFYPLIEPAIDKALRDLRTDPHRAAIGLVDTGLRVSQDPDRRRLLEELRLALQNEACAYHQFLARIAGEASARSVKTVGRNLVRGCLGDGAASLAKLEVAWQQRLPRCVAFDLRAAPGRTPSLGRLDELIRQGKSLGIFAYLILTGRQGYTPLAWHRLLVRHPDCIFLLMAPPAVFDCEAVSLLAGLPHLLCCLPLEDVSAATQAAALLRRGHMLYGGMAPCGPQDDPARQLQTGAGLHCTFLILQQQTDTPAEQINEARRLVDSARRTGQYPLVPFCLDPTPAHSAVLQLEWRRDQGFLSGEAPVKTLGQLLRVNPAPL